MKPSFEYTIKLFGIPVFKTVKKAVFPIVEIGNDGNVHLYHGLMVHGNLHATNHMTTQANIMAAGDVGFRMEKQKESLEKVYANMPRL